MHKYSKRWNLSWSDTAPIEARTECRTSNKMQAVPCLKTRTLKVCDNHDDCSDGGGGGGGFV